jgi:hypothetical protein
MGGLMEPEQIDVSIEHLKRATEDYIFRENRRMILRAFNMTNELEKAAIPEPKPETNTHPCSADMAAGFIIENWGSAGHSLVRDIMARKEFGLKKYGTPLQPFNGRNTLNDLYQELVDGLKYATSAIYEAKELGLSSQAPIDIRNNLIRAAIMVRSMLDKQKAN